MGSRQVLRQYVIKDPHRTFADVERDLRPYRLPDSESLLPSTRQIGMAEELRERFGDRTYSGSPRDLDICGMLVIKNVYYVMESSYSPLEFSVTVVQDIES